MLNDIITPPFTEGQKQLIEMTEKLAEKRGGKICDVDDDIKDVKELLEETIDRIEAPTNFDKITKNEATLTDWLQEKMCFCTEMPCSECIANKECWHQGNDTEYSNAELWFAWLKEKHNE